MIFACLTLFLCIPGWNSEEAEWDLCSGAALPVTGGNDTNTVCLRLFLLYSNVKLSYIHSHTTGKSESDQTFFVCFLLFFPHNATTSVSDVGFDGSIQIFMLIPTLCSLKLGSQHIFNLKMEMRIFVFSVMLLPSQQWIYFCTRVGVKQQNQMWTQNKTSMADNYLITFDCITS